jgi:hypothetical protein
MAIMVSTAQSSREAPRVALIKVTGKVAVVATVEGERKRFLWGFECMVNTS